MQGAYHHATKVLSKALIGDLYLGSGLFCAAPPNTTALAFRVSRSCAGEIPSKSVRGELATRANLPRSTTNAPVKSTDPVTVQAGLALKGGAARIARPLSARDKAIALRQGR